MKTDRWTLWAAAVSAAALVAMALCVIPGRGNLPALEPQAVTTAPPAVAEERVDLNTADLEELMTLPGIGEKRAAAVIAYRTEHGPFRYPEELIYVPGIGEGLLEDLMDLITTGGG